MEMNHRVFLCHTMLSYLQSNSECQAVWWITECGRIPAFMQFTVCSMIHCCCVPGGGEGI